MTIQDEYFVIETDFYKTSILEFNETYYENNADQISSLDITEAAYIHNPIHLTIDKIQRDPVLTSFMYSDSMHYILEEKLLDILLPLNLKNTQYFPVHLKDRKGTKHTNYFMWYIHNTISCVDVDKSKVEEKGDKEDNEYFISKLVLDESVLVQLYQEDRLVFRLAESPDILIAHESLVEELNKYNVTGVKFHLISEWYANI